MSDAALPEAVQERWSSLKYLQAAHPDSPVEVSLTVDGKLQGTVDGHESTSMAFGRTFLGQVEETKNGQWLPRASKLQFHLAQCPLSSLPCLERDAPPSRCLPTQPERSNLWFAVGKVTSHLHYDCWHNLLQVVRGHKRVLLLPPWYTRSLNPRPAHGASANHSQLTDEEVLVACQAEAMVLEVAAGASVFIPEGWWHRVESSGPVTAALNYWWSPVTPPLCHGPMAAYVLRRAFDTLVREEQRRMCGLPESAQPPLAESAEASMREDGGIALGTEPPCPACGRAVPPIKSGVAEFFAAADESEARLCAWLASCEPQQVAWCLGQCAALAPARLRSTLRKSFSPRTAFALGERLDESLHTNCGTCVQQTQLWIEAAFDAVGEDSRTHLRSLTDNLLKAAADNVLRQTLGLKCGAEFS